MQILQPWVRQHHVFGSGRHRDRLAGQLRASSRVFGRHEYPQGAELLAGDWLTGTVAQLVEQCDAPEAGEQSRVDQEYVLVLVEQFVGEGCDRIGDNGAEFVPTLTFMRQDEALRFLLESIIGDDSSVSYNSLEQKNLAYLQNCLNCWLRVWEEECEVKLLSKSLS